MGGRGIKVLSYANVSDQVKIIDTVKFYQEPLYVLANIIEPNERENI